MTKQEHAALVKRKHDLEVYLSIARQEITLFEAEIHRINTRLAQEPVKESPQSRIGWLGTTGTDMEEHDY